MATHSSILAWKIPWTEESGRLQSRGLRRVRHDWVTGCTTLAKKFFWSRDQLTLRVRRSLFTSQRNSLLKSKQPSQFSQFSHSVVSNSLWPHRLWPTRLLCSWNSPGKNMGWVAISFSRQSSWSRDWTRVSCIGRQILYRRASREACPDQYGRNQSCSAANVTDER